jgi:hypothetical protein
MWLRSLTREPVQTDDRCLPWDSSFMALREGSRDETPFEGLVFLFYHFALETYRQSGPKTAYLGLGESKNDRFRCK